MTDKYIVLPKGSEEYQRGWNSCREQVLQEINSMRSYSDMYKTGEKMRRGLYLLISKLHCY